MVMRGSLILLLLPLAASQGVIGFNKLIALELPTINKQLQSVLPASYGNCKASTASGPAPAPCEDTGDNLYSVHKSWAYKAEARWITGINSLQFTSIVLTNTSGSFDGVQGAGFFGDLPASIHIEQCATFDRCTNLWDNTHACCGTNKKFSFTVGLRCTSNQTLQDMGLKVLTIDDFEIQENVLGIDLPSKDITDPVHAALVTALTKYLTQPIISHNGTQETLVQWLNDVGSMYVSQLC